MSKTTFRYNEKKCSYILFFVLIFFSSAIYAQTKISGIVNSYTSVTGVNLPVCNVCDLNCTHTITVADASNLAVGDKALIIQMKGATISSANDATGGSITSINDAGNYEFFEIANIVGNVITPRYPLIRSYNVTGKVQVVKIPNYVEADINGTITSLDWNDAAGIGGVVAISAKTLIFNADIDVNGRGFRGIQMPMNGTPDNCSINPSTQFVLPDTNNSSYTRGEGIALFNSATNRGRAPRANGGGSGVSGDSGGGGGSNYGAGGEGGKRWCNTGASGLNAGGIGGYAMTSYLAQDKAFLGGAGGPGWVSTNNPSTAADGGGIVIIFADQIIGNGHFIHANGLSPNAVNPVGPPDGGGGGGAGGTVVLKVNQYSSNLTVNVNGGDGQDLNTNTIHGPGGGGGGGVLLYSKASLPVNVTVNTTGGIGGQHLNGDRNGSQDGAVGGSISLYIPVENPNYVGNTDTDSVPENCDLDDDNDGILDTVELAGLPDPFEDADADKIPNYQDPSTVGFVDTNSDGIDDRYDTDLDGIINQLDLDSDNDGCFDANEYYNSKTADGGDGGVYGVGTPTVDATGKVNGPVAAPYSGSYANVIVPFKITNPLGQNTTVGGNVTFSVTVSGGSSTTYKWQVSTDGGTNWSDIVNGGVYADATTANLKLTGVTLSMKNNSYRVIASDTNYVCELVTESAVLSYTNSAPVAVDDNYTVAEEGTVTLLPLSLDTDVDGDVLSIASINGTVLTPGIAQEILVTNGKVNVSAAGVITFTPSLNYNGPISFPYVINDGNSGTATANENITVTPENDAPVAQNNAYSGSEDAVSITGNIITDTDATAGLDADIDSTTLTVKDYTIAGITGTQAVGSAVTIPSVGDITILADGSLTFVPLANYNGTVPTITYTLTDGALTDTADVVITVTPENDAPIAQNNAYSGLEDAVSITGNIITDTDATAGLDADIDSTTLTVKDYTIAGITGPQAVGSAVTIPSVGDITILADGSLTFVPLANYNGTVPTITYTLTDGVLTDAAAVVITVTPENDAPVAQNNAYSGSEDAVSITGNIITDTDATAGLDADIDSTTLTVKDYAIAGITGTQAVGSAVTIPSVGDITILANGSLTFVPLANYNGTVPTITYTLTDGFLTDAADVVITVTPENDAPIANDDTNTILSAAAGPTMINALTASDIDGTIVSYTILNLPVNGVLALSGIPVAVNQVLTPDEVTALTYDPSGVFSGNEVFTFTATDNNGAVDATPATYTIPVVNEVVASNDGVHSVNNVTGKTIDSVLTNDVLNGIVLTPATFDLVELTPINVPSGFTLNKDGSVDVKEGTPAGSYSLVYEICTKATPVVCDQATVTVTVTCNTTKISGVVRDVLNNKPLVNVPVTLIPDKATTGPVLLMLTKADGSYNFAGFAEGDYIIQVQDANLNNAQNLYNVGPSLYFLNIQKCTYEVRNFDYDKTDLPVLGNFVWYDKNSNGLQDEWFDANNDGLVTQNFPDANGYIDYSKWEWIDFNGDGKYTGKENEGEINAAGLGNGTTNVPNLFITGPNGFSREITMSIQGYWRTRGTLGNFGDYQVKIVMEPNLEAAAQAKFATGLVKNLPTPLYKNSNTKATQSFVVCGFTNADTRTTNLSLATPIDNTIDFGVQCQLYATLVAQDDVAGPIMSVASETKNVLNVLVNDTSNGAAVQLADINLTVTIPNPNLRLNADGSVDVLANTPAGTYEMTYQICEKSNPSNCQSAIVKVTVVAPVITATNDDFSSKPIDASKGAVLDIMNNDTINAGSVASSQVVLTLVDSNGVAGVTIESDGKITIPVGTPVGTYVLTYSICDVINPNNCATATITIVVKDPCDFDDSSTSCDILVHNAFTPNNDGLNEVFTIERIENYPENTVEIYNRWGVLVFEVKGYDNTSKVFSGISEGRVTVNKAEALPNGTYYYVIKYKKPISGKMNQKAGFLYLSR